MKRALLVFATFAAFSCSPKVLPVSNTQKDSTALKTDEKEVIRDSIFIDRLQTIREKGDTVFVTDTRYEYRDRWRDREVHDTTYVERLRETEKVVEVSKPLTAWQKFQKNGFWVLLSVIIIAIIIRFLRWYFKKFS